MLSRNIIEQQLATTLSSIDVPNLGNKISGKVRDSYVVGDKRILITSDRLSAFDVILTTIPFKGQVLNDMTAFWFDATSHIIENHIIDRPHPNVFISQQLEILPIEVIVRGYLTGSAWRDYQAGKQISGITLPQGMQKSQQFETPLITPSTKAEQGEHDMPISSEEIVKQGIIEESLWNEVCEAALALFAFGSAHAKEQGLLFVDTKYEFGTLTVNGKKKLIVADEIHTSDSSRYWIADGYNERFSAGEDQKMLDKEFVRGWLMEQGYMGDGEPPAFPAEKRIDTAVRYIEAYEKITGQEFSAEAGVPTEAIKDVLANFKA